MDLYGPFLSIGDFVKCSFIFIIFCLQKCKIVDRDTVFYFIFIKTTYRTTSLMKNNIHNIEENADLKKNTFNIFKDFFICCALHRPNI